MHATLTKPSRAAPMEWVQVALLAANLAWTTLCLGGFRADTLVVTSALNGALLVAHLLARREAGLHPAGWWLLPFLAYAAANVVWVTPVPWLGWRDWLLWAQMIAVFWVVLNGVRSRAGRAALFGTLLALALVAVVLGAYQRFVKPDWLMLGRVQAVQFHGRASGCFGIPNSLAALLLLVLPATAALALQRGATAVQRVLCGYLAAVFAFGLVLTVSRGAWLALLLVLAAWPVAAGRAKLGRRLAWSAGALVALVAAIAALSATVPLVRERLASLQIDSGEPTRPIMWRGAWKIFQEHPVWGGGAGSYDDLFEKFRPEGYLETPLWAHNDYLNTLADYGAVGFALFFGACGAIVWRCCRTERVRADGKTAARRAGGLPGGALAAGLAAFAVQLFVDFHLKSGALAMAAAVVGALALQSAWPASEAKPATGAAGRVLAAVVALAVAVGTAGWVVPAYRGEAWRYEARQTIDGIARARQGVAKRASQLFKARALLERAVAVAPANGRAWSDLAYAIALGAHVAPERAGEIGREAERAADRALERSQAVAEFWVRRGVALDLQGRWIEAGGPFVRALRLAPARAMTWYHQAYHLSLDPTDLGPAEAAVRVSLRLDPGNREAQALLQRLADRRRAH